MPAEELNNYQVGMDEYASSKGKRRREGYASYRRKGMSASEGRVC